MALTGNSLAGFLAVYAQKSLTAFLADMPPRDLFTENFDDSIATGGISVTTRIPKTIYGSLNNLGTSGWESANATASAVTITLATKGHDHPFNVTEWATVTPSMLESLYFPVLAKQTANGVTVEAINNVTSSTYVTTSIVGTPGGFSLAGTTGSLQECGALLDVNEVPVSDRYCILSPESWRGLISGMYQTYVYGDPTIVRKNGYSDSPSSVGLYAAGFNCFRYPRMYGAPLPYGGDKVHQTGDKLVGIAGNKQGIVMACRTPLDMNTGLIQSYTATDPSSKISLQVILAFDQSKPVWRIGTYILFGTAVGNERAVIPILSST
jgi:hypothetical protein